MQNKKWSHVVEKTTAPAALTVPPPPPPPPTPHIVRSIHRAICCPQLLFQVVFLASNWARMVDVQVVQEHLKRLLQQVHRGLASFISSRHLHANPVAVWATEVAFLGRPHARPPWTATHRRRPTALLACACVPSPQVDMDKETQRSIFQKLQTELGVNLEEHKPLIKVAARGARWGCGCGPPAATYPEPCISLSLRTHTLPPPCVVCLQEEIDAFLLRISDEDDDDFEAPSPPAAKRQKGPAGGAVAGTPPAAPQGELVMPLSAKRFATVRTYNGRKMADIREFYEKEGKLEPGTKGLALQAPAWATLSASLQQLGEALAQKDTEFAAVELGGGKRATISAFKGGRGGRVDGVSIG